MQDGRICLSNNAAERALRGVAMQRSLYPSSSSICKHWKLVCEIDATRTTCSPDRGGHSFGVQIDSSDLVRSARHDLFGGEDAVLDQSTKITLTPIMIFIPAFPFDRRR
jgi:hypothetical protein